MAFGRMMKERFARVMVIILVVGVSAAALVARWSDQRIEIHAAMPEAGGWMPENLVAQVDEPLTLRLISDDVMHGFAIGQSDRPAVDVVPGKAIEVTLLFDEPGTYTFYCTRWCGANHWRMRGTISVEGQNLASEPKPPDPALYVSLGIDLDSPHMIEDIPAEIPSSKRGEMLIDSSKIETDFSPEAYPALTPDEFWQSLKANPDNQMLSNADLWDVAAAIWEDQTNSEKLALGGKLYAQNCAACHGVSGAGDGIFSQPEPNDSSNMVNEVELKPATDFTNAESMLGASSAQLQGKILRGGMGTGMPSWGLIFTDEQTWAVIDYLWSFQFNYKE